MPAISRETLLAHLLQTLTPDPRVRAIYEGGSAAFARVDRWSDLDLMIIVEDEAVEAVAARVDEAVAILGPVDTRYEIPRPAWHGHYQVFYRLANASPYLLIDLVILQASSPNRFVEAPVHGRRLAHYDPDGLTAPPPFDEAGHARAVAERVATIRRTFDFWQAFVWKEIHRGSLIEAVGFYLAFTVQPLVVLLRAQANPYHYNFNTRQIYYDLPRDVLDRLEPLYCVGGLDDLRAKLAAAVDWTAELGCPVSRFARTGAEQDWR